MFKTLIQKLQEDKYLTLETTPQHEPSMHNIIEKIKKFNLQDKIDGFSCTDNPLAKLRYNSLFAALKLQQEFEKPVIATMTMRDRNKIALQSDLLGANDFDVRAILALTGDPAKMSDQPNSKGVLSCQTQTKIRGLAHWSEASCVWPSVQSSGLFRRQLVSDRRLGACWQYSWQPLQVSSFSRCQSVQLPSLPVHCCQCLVL